MAVIPSLINPSHYEKMFLNRSTRRNLDNAFHCQGFALGNEDGSKMKRLIKDGVNDNKRGF
jgi:hypothetical protein